MILVSSTYLWQTEHQRQDVSSPEQAMAPFGHVERLHGVLDRYPPVHSDQHQDIGAQVEAEHLEELHQLAGELIGQPLDGVAPGRLPNDAEPGDQDIGNRQVEHQRIDGAPRVPGVPSRNAGLVDIPDGQQVAEQGEQGHHRQDVHLEQPGSG